MLCTLQYLVNENYRSICRDLLLWQATCVWPTVKHKATVIIAFYALQSRFDWSYPLCEYRVSRRIATSGSSLRTTGRIVVWDSWALKLNGANLPLNGSKWMAIVELPRCIAYMNADCKVSAAQKQCCNERLFISCSEKWSSRHRHGTHFQNFTTKFTVTILLNYKYDFQLHRHLLTNDVIWWCS